MSSLRDEIKSVKEKVNFYLSVNRFDTAENLLKATLSDYGPIANLHNLLGLTYHKQSKFSDAIKQFKRAIEINPSYIESTLNLAATLCDLSQYDSAHKLFVKLDQHTPANRNIPNTILGRIADQHAKCGNMYSECEMQSEAIREFRLALALYQNLPDVKIALAKLYLETGKMENAQAELEELVRSAPNHTDGRVWLGITYYKQGNHQMAQKQWQTSSKASGTSLQSKAYKHIAAALKESSKLR